MRVAFVIQKFAGLRGGAERVVTDVARGLQARGHQATIVTFEPGTGPPGYDVGGVEVVDVFPSVLRRAFTGRAAAPRLDAVERQTGRVANDGIAARLKWHTTHGLFARRVASWLRSNPQDAVVGVMPPGISAAAVARSRLRGADLRVIASTHNIPEVDFGPGGRWDPNPVARRTNLWALEASDAVTVLQPEFVDQLPSAARPTAVVMPNAVTRLPTGEPVERLTRIVGVGRLTDVKRYDVLITAFGRVADDHPDWDVVVFGDGPERSRLVELVDEHGLDGRVRFPGTTGDIGDEYERARILCHPARYEGFGLVVAEAILHGVDVLASTHCTGVNRLVEDGATGILVDDAADPVEAFENGLRRLMTDPPSAEDHAAAAEQLRASLDPERILDGWERVLEGGRADPR